MNEVYVMLNLVALLVSGLYWYTVLTKKDPIYRIALCLVTVVVWYTTAQAVIRVDTLGNAVAILYDFFTVFHILSGFKEVWAIWRTENQSWWG